jgi:hypothetical protein
VYRYPPPQFHAPPPNGYATAGFVTGLLGVLLCWVPVIGLVLAVLGITFGANGLAVGRRTGASTGLAIAGLVLGILGALVGMIIFVFVVVDG